MIQFEWDPAKARVNLRKHAFLTERLLMKKKSKAEKADDLRPEYDLRGLLKDGVQGKYADRFREGTNLVLLDRDIAEAFPSDEAVNTALRLVIQLKKLPRSEKRNVPKESDPAT
jgi:hypothetical protein